MILSGKEILKEMDNGNIKITPFNINQLNPNSYNLKLANELLVYDIPRIENARGFGNEFVTTDYTTLQPLDMHKDNPTRTIRIPEEGYVLYPGMLYLGKTVEFTETHNFIPCVEGRSSIGRLGINIHVVREISVVQPVSSYPNSEICQIYYHEIKGEIEEYKGKYQNQTDTVGSRIYEECK